MTIQELKTLLQESPLIASVQADPGTPLSDPETLQKLARTSLDQGVKILRMQGVENIRAAQDLGVPVIGLIKREYPLTTVYITPTAAEVHELLETNCEVIALDATIRLRPNHEELNQLVKIIHSGEKLAMADCDNELAVDHALQAGCDLISTTLSGYTENSLSQPGPDLDLIRYARTKTDKPILAEGRYTEPWQARAALQAGATAVVIGGALNDPIKQTRRFLHNLKSLHQRVGCVDLGGTWLRFATYNGQTLENIERIPLPQIHQDRLDFITQQAKPNNVNTIGISAGGVIDPVTQTVTDAKSFIPDYVGQTFQIPDLQTYALNDGLATAWGHANHPDLAGLHVATLALGSGVGAGTASLQKLETDAKGDYPRLNDLPFQNTTLEATLGGLQLTDNPNGDQKQQAIQAAEFALQILRAQFPDRIVVCGGVGLSPWFQDHLRQSHPDVLPSPHGENAGLIGAAYLALRPPANVWTPKA